MSQFDEVAARHSPDPHQGIEVVRVQGDDDSLALFRPETVGVIGAAVLLLGVAIGQFAGLLGAQSNSRGPGRSGRRGPFAKRQAVAPAVRPRQGPRPQHIGSVLFGRKAQPRVRALTQTVVVFRQGLVRSFGVKGQIGVEGVGSKHRLQPLARARGESIVVIDIVAVGVPGVAVRQGAVNGRADPQARGLLRQGGRDAPDQGQGAGGGEKRGLHEEHSKSLRPIIDAERGRL